MFTDLAVGKIMDHKDKTDPLFLMVSHLAVHSANSRAPLQAPEKDQKLFPDVKHSGRKTYLAMVASLDQGVGRVSYRLRPPYAPPARLYNLFTSHASGNTPFYHRCCEM